MCMNAGRGWNSLAQYIRYRHAQIQLQADFSHSIQLKNNRPGDEATRT